MASRVTEEEIEAVFYESKQLGMTVGMIAYNIGISQSRVRYILKHKKPKSILCRMVEWLGVGIAK